MDGKFFWQAHAKHTLTVCGAFKSVFLLDGETPDSRFVHSVRESNGKFHESIGSSSYEIKWREKMGNFDKRAQILFCICLSSKLMNWIYVGDFTFVSLWFQKINICLFLIDNEVVLKRLIRRSSNSSAFYAILFGDFSSQILLNSNKTRRFFCFLFLRSNRHEETVKTALHKMHYGRLHIAVKFIFNDSTILLKTTIHLLLIVRATLKIPNRKFQLGIGLISHPILFRLRISLIFANLRRFPEINSKFRYKIS